MYNIGIVGTGGVAHTHARGVQNESRSLRLVSACDTNAARLAEFGKRYEVTGLYEDYRKIIKDPDIDAVIVLVPHHMHEQVCVEALNEGKHVLVEKPIARTLEDADNIIGAAEKMKKTLMVGHNQRYTPTHLKIHEMLKNNSFGHIFCARADHYQNFNPPQSSLWRSKEVVGGGCIIGSGIHRLDLLRWYLGEVEEVFAYEVYNPKRLEGEVACTAVLKFKSGAVGEFICNWGIYQYPYEESISLFGETGSVYSDTEKPFLLAGSANNEGDTPIEVQVEQKYESMWSHFAECIATGDTPLTSGPESRKSLELVLAINRSAATGKPVRLSSE